jgi:hypothetical protein
MGILQERVRQAFSLYKAGDFKAFVRALVEAGDCRYQFHRDIVDSEVERQLSEM